MTDYPELVSRLRNEADDWRNQVGNMPIFDEAADAIEALTSEMHQRELHHFETERAMERALAALRRPGYDFAVNIAIKILEEATK